MTKKLKSSSQRVQDKLSEYQLDLKVVEFDELTRTSQEAADTIGCEVGQIAKTLIFKGKSTGKAVCVVASGTNRVDEKKIRKILGEKVERPDADFVLQQTGFAIGGVPPIGYKLEVLPLIDNDLLTYDEIWAAAGTPNAVFRLQPKDLVTITQGQVVDIKA